MEQYLIMCRSLTYAQRAVQTLERAGVPVHLTKLPQSIAATGCSYGVRVPARWLQSGLDLLARGGHSYGKIYRYQSDGSLKEMEP